MINETEEEKATSRNPFTVFMGLLVGGIAGAITVFLLAPQSGKDTRKQIREKANDLQTQTTEMVNDRAKQVRSNVTEFRNSGQKKIKELKQNVLGLAGEKLGSSEKINSKL